MSDDELDRLYEEDLKAERGYRELWVEMTSGQKTRVRTFPDTEEWREACDTAAFQILKEPTVARCWSVPMEVGGGGGSLPSAQPTSTGRRVSAPVDGPDVVSPPPSRQRLSRRLWMETRRVGLDPDPSAMGGVLGSDPTGPCPAHPSWDGPWWLCPTCSDRWT